MTKSKRQREKRRQRRAESHHSTMLLADCVVDIQAASDEDGSDKPATFSMVAYTGGAMRPRGYDIDVVVDMAGVTVAAGARPILLHHDTSQIVGHATEVTVDGQIEARGVISGAGPAADQVRASSKNGFPWRASIGASVESMEEVEAGAEAEANGQTFQGPCLIARQTTLNEISFVPIAADNATSATVAASAARFNEKDETDMTPQEFAASLGLEWGDLTAAQQQQFEQIQAGSTDTETVEASQDGDLSSVRDELAALRQEMQAERNAARINSICAQYDGPQIEVDGSEVDLAAHAIENNWSVERTELEALRSSRPSSPAIHSRSHDSACTLEAMQAASLVAGGVPLDSPHFRTMQAHGRIPSFLQRDLNDDTRQRYMDAAHRYSDMSAVDICRESLRLAGKTVPSGRMDAIQAAFSTMTLNNIFTTSVNAQLLVAYMEAGDTTVGWCSEADVPNFLTNERIRDGSADDLTKLAPNNEAAHEVPADTEETYKIARYAKQFTVDEQHIINDALNVLRQKPQMMGRAAARLRPDLVYSILLANGNLADGVALFHTATHGNLQASSALAEATLRTAIALVEKQVDGDATLNLRASHVIVPSDLKHTAAQLIRSASIVFGGDDESTRGSENTLASVESLTLVSDARLANGVTDPDSGTAHSGSATTWFLASDQAHTVEVGYLRGSGRAPRVRSTNLTQGRYGINFDVNMDIGAKALDYRGLVKSTA